jgi:membrane-bound metal-dependent hydrolase YbcI (DUF457 family)
MDIFTHVAIGAAATGPFWATHPLESVAFVLGSVLPDIDALSRQFGKVAYLQAHQTWTHALVVQVAIGLVLGVVLVASDLAVFVPSVVAMLAGAVLHSVLDWTNTYGVKLFAPFDRRRHALEWVFFIDGFVIATTLAAVALQAWSFGRTGAVPVGFALGWAALTIGYVAAKRMLRARAAGRLPDAQSLVPSSWCPWRFYALSLGRDRATTCRVDAISGAIAEVAHHTLADTSDLAHLAEFRAMRGLSAGFVATKRDAQRVVVRDLRTRNFGTNFGRLTVSLTGDHPTVESFDV